MSSVVVVEIRSYLELHLEGTPKGNRGFSQNPLPCVWEDNFDGWYHGMVDKVVNLDEFTRISVKITWRTIDRHIAELPCFEISKVDVATSGTNHVFSRMRFLLTQKIR